ncbi:MAG: glycosyltransferase family 4 protein [Solirubrobacterales bacterium]|nr:glycosyltransferase family 4 protein [Solirubrobacterales bacterium]
MRLLYLSADPGVPVLGHKGASVHLRELCAALVQAGAELHIASPRIEPEGDELLAPAEVHPIPAVPAKTPDPVAVTGLTQAQADAVTTLARRLGAQAVYERFSLYSAAGVRTAAALGLPHALEVNAPLREEAARYRTLLHPELAARLESEVMAATDRVLAVSEPLAATLAHQGVEAAKIEVVPNGVCAARFGSPRRDPARFLVGFAGSLKPWHGVEVLVDALTRVPQAHLQVVGHGPLEHLLERLPAERVTRLGARPHAETIELMAGWDVGVAPYMPIDGFWFSPLKVLEYMAAGACPVCSDLGEARELLGGGGRDERGVLVRAGDPGALAQAIAALARDRERARRLGQRARAWAALHRSWSVNAQRALAALEPRRRRSAA